MTESNSFFLAAVDREYPVSRNARDSLREIRECFIYQKFFRIFLTGSGDEAAGICEYSAKASAQSRIIGESFGDDILGARDRFVLTGDAFIGANCRCDSAVEVGLGRVLDMRMSANGSRPSRERPRHGFCVSGGKVDIDPQGRTIVVEAAILASNSGVNLSCSVMRRRMSSRRASRARRA